MKSPRWSPCTPCLFQQDLQLREGSLGLPASHGVQRFFSLNTYIKPEYFQSFLKAEIKVQDPI